VKSNYHALHVLKTAEQSLCKGIRTNCNKELVIYINECVLNVLNSNLQLSDCNTRKVQKYKLALRNVADRHASLFCKKRLIVERGRFLLPLLSAIQATIASLILNP